MTRDFKVTVKRPFPAGIANDQDDRRDWPTREEWAKGRRTVYGFREISQLASDYATEAEIAEAIAALRQMWRESGRVMRAHKQAGRDDDATQEGYRRREINFGILDLKVGKMPSLWRSFIPQPPAFKLIFDRYEAADQQAQEAYAQKVANTPIDDEAWQRELARRERIDRTGGITIC